MKTKCLAVGIILLFIGVAVAPSINQSIVKASQEDDLVEVTTQACGINGYGNTTVKLTREQYAEVEKLFNDIQMKLNATKTMMDAIPIYYNAVVQLNKYGLLPEGMNVETAQKLVTGGYKYKEKTTLFRESANTLTNALCFIVGLIIDSYYIDLYSPLMIIFLIMSLPILVVATILAIIFGNPIIPLYIFAVTLEKIITFPVGFMNVIKLDSGTNGVISTLGILGISSIEGDMNGIIAGFTGLKFWRGDSIWLLGFSLYIDIENY
jgi:hypothetical protein